MTNLFDSRTILMLDKTNSRGDRMKIHQSTEDYLEAILMITKEKGTCRSIDVVNKLGYKKSSVSVAMSKLVEEGLVNKASSGELTLTDEGLRISKGVLEKHEFFMKWLISMGIDEEVAYEDACRMEHAVSDESFYKMREYVNGNN